MSDRSAPFLGQRDVLCGLTVSIVGLAACFEAWSYSFGSLARPGPGFLPVSYGMILIALGLAIAYAGRNVQTRVEKPAFVPVFAISGALLTWAWFAPRAGIVLATVLLVVLAALANGRAKPTEIGLIAIFTSAITTAVFVGILGVPLPVWPWS